LSCPFEITAEDIETVLRQNAVHVADSKGIPFSAYAEVIFDEMTSEDFTCIENAALASGEDLIEEQLPAAYAALRVMLVEQGVLKR
jgi:predicted small metal-binding protein